MSEPAPIPDDLHVNWGIDFGLKRDRTAIVGTYNQDGLVKLAHVKTWRAPKGGEVQVSEIESYLLMLHAGFPSSLYFCDPYQAISSIQRLREAGLMIEEFIFSPKNITRFTQNLFTLFKDRRIKLFNHDELIKELLTVKIIERNYGIRIDHDSGKHDDITIALALSALHSNQEPAAPVWYMGQ